jgi:hypothetical protein
MKKLLIACLLFSGWGMAQNIVFKDSIVKRNVVLSFDKNSDKEISVSEANNVDTLNLYDLGYSIEDISDLVNFPNISSLKISANLIDSVNINYLKKLTAFDWDLYKKVKYLNLNSSSVKKLSLSNNYYKTSLSDFQLTNFQNLVDLSVSDFFIGDLNIDLLQNLKHLSIRNYWYNDTITESLDLTKNTELQFLYVYGCPNIKSLDLTQNFKLIDVQLNGLKLVELLDFSNCQQIDYIDVIGFDKLTYLNVKNGKIERVSFERNNNSIKYICADEVQLNEIVDSLKLFGMTAEVNSYCSFTPGGLFNTITSNVKFDETGNCNGNDKYLSYTKFSIEDQNGIGYSVTDKDGIVQFYKQKGTYKLNPLIENPNYFLISPQSLNFSLNDNSGHDTTINFCITPNGVHKDLEVILAPYGSARPGFDATYLVTYKNKGNQTLSGDLNVTYNEDVLDFVRSTMSTNTNGNVSTTFAELKPFEVRVDTLVLNVNSPIETPAVNINDTLKFVATINPTNEDETPTDNVFELNQRVVGAYDPNLITCLQGNELKTTEIGKTLHYTIEFENTGNYPAENIVVVEEIDPKKYDINSIQILNSSHPMKFRVEGNKVEYYFEKIQLGEHKHGNILLKLNSNEELKEGDDVTKQANIYFDYNAPVQTNNEKTVYRDLKASIADLKEDVSISVYPNPGKGNVNVRAAKNIKSIEVYDVNGRVIKTKVVSSIQTEINLSDEMTGVYFIKVTTEEGANVIKYQKD